MPGGVYAPPWCGEDIRGSPPWVPCTQPESRPSHSTSGTLAKNRSSAKGLFRVSFHTQPQQPPAAALCTYRRGTRSQTAAHSQFPLSRGSLVRTAILWDDVLGSADRAAAAAPGRRHVTHLHYARGMLVRPDNRAWTKPMTDPADSSSGKKPSDKPDKGKLAHAEKSDEDQPPQYDPNAPPGTLVADTRPGSPTFWGMCCTCT